MCQSFNVSCQKLSCRPPRLNRSLTLQLNWTRFAIRSAGDQRICVTFSMQVKRQTKINKHRAHGSDERFQRRLSYSPNDPDELVKVVP